MDNINFRYLTNLQSSFQLIRVVAIVFVIAAVMISLGSIYWASQVVEKSRQRVYVMENGKSLMVALAQDQNINRPAEGRDHVRIFHKLFFTLEPDEKQILQSIKEATYFGDASLTRLFKDYQEKGYYQQLIQGNVHQKVEIDSVNIGYTQSPYYVRTVGRQLLIRSNTITVRRLVTECYLIDVPRTDNNSHGFSIERFKVLDNRDLETIQRTPSYTTAL